MNISQSLLKPATMTPGAFDIAEDGDEIKQNAFLAVITTHGVNLTAEAFNSLVLEAFTLNNHIVRGQMLATVLKDLDKGTLTSENINTAIKYLVSRVDSTAATLGRMVELVDECKTPGPRH